MFEACGATVWNLGQEKEPSLIDEAKEAISKNDRGMIRKICNPLLSALNSSPRPEIASRLVEILLFFAEYIEKDPNHMAQAIEVYEGVLKSGTLKQDMQRAWILGRNFAIAKELVRRTNGGARMECDPCVGSFVGSVGLNANLKAIKHTVSAALDPYTRGDMENDIIQTWAEQFWFISKENPRAAAAHLLEVLPKTRNDSAFREHLVQTAIDFSGELSKTDEILAKQMLDCAARHVYRGSVEEGIIKERRSPTNLLGYLPTSFAFREFKINSGCQTCAPQ
jgi:hypothetical protein